jgi:hypothetical protein
MANQVKTATPTPLAPALLAKSSAFHYASSGIEPARAAD